MFATFVFSLPALILRDNRGWLKLHGWLVIVCAIFSLLVGLVIWIETLKTRTNLDVLWGKQSAAVQSLLQQTVRQAIIWGSISDLLTREFSSNAVAIRTVPRLRSLLTTLVLQPSLQRSCRAVRVHSALSRIGSWILSSLPILALSVRFDSTTAIPTMWRALILKLHSRRLHPSPLRRHGSQRAQRRRTIPSHRRQNRRHLISALRYPRLNKTN